jgi:hypothetical protein
VETNQPVYAAEDVYLNSKGELVGADDLDITTKVASAGAPIPAEHVDAYNAYSAAQPAAEEAAEGEAEGEGKSLASPPANKMQAGPQQSKAGK